MENMAGNTRERLFAQILPIIREFPATPVYAIALGGSRGKGAADDRSDYDFRVYYERPVQGRRWDEVNGDLWRCIAGWKALGVEVDGTWPRRIGDIDAELDRWLSGTGVPEAIVWSVWGYHLPTDIYNQTIIEDPCGVARRWKEQLAAYPDALRDSILRRHAGSLRYWRADYHYRSKAERRDAVFLASVTARLMHDVMQVLYALNRSYFPGDGLNLVLARDFGVRPEGLEERAGEILYPGSGQDACGKQYAGMISLIDDVLSLVADIL